MKLPDMKLTLVLAVCATICAAHVLPDPEAKPTVPGDNSHYVEGVSRYIWMPVGMGEDDEAVLVDLQEPVDTALVDEIMRNPANTKYLLYTRKNPTDPQTLQINNPSSIQNSNFNPDHSTIFIVHGWLSNQDTNINPTIRDAYLGKSDFNVIVVDWKRLAMSGYINAVNGVPAVGWGVGQFIRFLSSTTGASFKTMHLVGFSLGAHVVGNAGRALGGEIARITALDPAGPLWNLNRDKISSNDAVYVEAIHTDGGYTVGGLGIGKDVGNVDFYPNGGVSQPGCLTSICNHNRAWYLFAATVTHNHLFGNECTSSMQFTLDRCSGQELPMGNDDLGKSGSGQYRVSTRRRYPY